MKYSIITTARNEDKYITATLESVINQTTLPREWIIVNDSSVDKTLKIVQKYSTQYAWIKIINLDNYKPELNSIGGRVSHILNLAVQNLKHDCEIIVKLDADTEFKPDFFKELLQRFAENNKLGIASGNLVFNGEKESVDYTKPNLSPRGAVMLIRKELFDQVDGFFQSKGRGEDTLFGVAARYHGWETRVFPIFFNHLKPESSRHSFWHEEFNTGYYKGSIPYRCDYFLLTQIKHFKKRPIILGTLLQLTGYLFSRLIVNYRPFPEYVKVQLQKEQISYINNKLDF
jgi:glycosyltransferase involved in cell wall biosynthesis